MSQWVKGVLSFMAIISVCVVSMENLSTPRLKLPLIDMKPAHPDAIRTAMSKAQKK